MDQSRMWCPRCEQMVSPGEKLNYPMTVGILGVLVAISLVFVWVTFLDRDFGAAETVALTLLVTVLPFGYMRLTRMRSRIPSCPHCGADDLRETPPSVIVLDV